MLNGGKTGVYNKLKSFLGEGNNHGFGALLFCSYIFITFVILFPYICFRNLGSFAFSFKYLFDGSLSLETVKSKEKKRSKVKSFFMVSKLFKIW